MILRSALHVVCASVACDEKLSSVSTRIGRELDKGEHSGFLAVDIFTLASFITRTYRELQGRAWHDIVVPGGQASSSEDLEEGDD